MMIKKNQKIKMTFYRDNFIIKIDLINKDS